MQGGDGSRGDQHQTHWGSRQWSAEEDAILLQHAWEKGTRQWGELHASGKLPKRDNKTCCNRFLFLKKRFMDERQGLSATMAQGGAPVLVSTRQGLIPLGRLTLAECDTLFLHSEAEKAANIKEAAAMAASLGLDIGAPKEEEEESQETSRDQVIASFMLHQMLGPAASSAKSPRGFPGRKLMPYPSNKLFPPEDSALPTAQLPAQGITGQGRQKGSLPEASGEAAGFSRKDQSNSANNDCLESLLQDNWLSSQRMLPCGPCGPSIPHSQPEEIRADHEFHRSSLPGLSSPNQASLYGRVNPSSGLSWGSAVQAGRQVEEEEAMLVASTLHLDSSTFPAAWTQPGPVGAAWVHCSGFSERHASTNRGDPSEEERFLQPTSLPEPQSSPCSHFTSAGPELARAQSLSDDGSGVSTLEATNMPTGRPQALTLRGIQQTSEGRRQDVLPKRRLCIPGELHRRVRQTTDALGCRSGGSAPLRLQSCTDPLQAPHGTPGEGDIIMLGRESASETEQEVALGLLQFMSLTNGCTQGLQFVGTLPGTSGLSGAQVKSGHQRTTVFKERPLQLVARRQAMENVTWDSHSEAEKAANIKEAAAVAASMSLATGAPNEEEESQEASTDQIIAGLMLQQMLGPATSSGKVPWGISGGEPLPNTGHKLFTLVNSTLPTVELPNLCITGQGLEKGLLDESPGKAAGSSRKDHGNSANSAWPSSQHTLPFGPGTSQSVRVDTREDPDNLFSTTLPGLTSPDKTGFSGMVNLSSGLTSGSTVQAGDLVDEEDAMRVTGALHLDSSTFPAAWTQPRPVGAGWVHCSGFSESHGSTNEVVTGGCTIAGAPTNAREGESTRQQPKVETQVEQLVALQACSDWGDPRAKSEIWTSGLSSPSLTLPSEAGGSPDTMHHALFEGNFSMSLAARDPIYPQTTPRCAPALSTPSGHNVTRLGFTNPNGAEYLGLNLRSLRQGSPFMIKIEDGVSLPDELYLHPDDAL